MALSRRLLPVLALLAPALPGQGVPAPGFRLAVRATLPGGAALAGFDATASGDLLILVGADLRLYGPGGVQTVFAFSPGSWGAFVRATRAGVVVAESTAGTVVLHDPGTGANRTLVQVGFPFDLAEAPDGGLYLSANPGFGTPISGNRIFFLDPVLGGADEVVRLAGPSGPVACDGAGNLYCAEQSPVYPTPPGAVRILRWSSSQVQAARGPGCLTANDAAVVAAGLDGAYGMALDRLGRLYFTDPQKGGVRRLGAGGVEVLAGVTPLTATSHTVIRIFEGSGPATLDPWQPRTGCLLVAATDYLTFARVEELAPARPALSGAPWPEVAPGRVLELRLDGGEPHGQAVLLVSPAAIPGEMPLPLGGPAPLFVGVYFHPLAFASLLVQDGQGMALCRLPYAGGGPMVLYAQVFLVGGPSGLAGSSNPWAFRLQ